jgi:predicted membrane-bound spermidine synthase
LRGISVEGCTLAIIANLAHHRRGDQWQLIPRRRSIGRPSREAIPSTPPVDRAPAAGSDSVNDAVSGAANAPAHGAAGQPARASARDPARIRASALYLNVFIVAICGLIYELLAGTLGSYLLGDSVTQFSLVIGLYLSAMGAGAWLSRQLETHLARRFLDVELAVAVVVGASAPVLFLAFGSVAHFQVVLLGFVAAIGVLVGLELPLLMRLLEGQIAFKDLVSRVLTFDYIGALAAAVLFPLVLMPKLGLVRSSLVMGVANASVALWGTWLLGEQLGRARRGLRLRAILVLIAMGVAVGFADRFTTWAEDERYADPVVFTETTPYQRIIVTRSRAGFQLFLNGNLQFASVDRVRRLPRSCRVAPAARAVRDHPARGVRRRGRAVRLGRGGVLARARLSRRVPLHPPAVRLGDDVSRAHR